MVSSKESKQPSRGDEVIASKASTKTLVGDLLALFRARGWDQATNERSKTAIAVAEVISGAGPEGVTAKAAARAATSDFLVLNRVSRAKFAEALAIEFNR